MHSFGVKRQKAKVWTHKAQPHETFHNFGASNPWIDEFYVVQKRRTTDFKASKFGKGSSGSCFAFCW